MGSFNVLMRNILLSLSLASLGWMSLCHARDQPVIPVQDPKSTRDRSSLMKNLEALRTENHISALGLVVVSINPSEPSFSFIEGLGSQAHDDPTPIDQGTVFRLGSVTKGFTAATLMRLVEQNEMKLNDRLSQHLDSALWRNNWAPEHPITLAQLMEHSAGFQDMGGAEFDSQEILDLETALGRYAKAHTAIWTPGRWHSYSNLGAGFLGYAMERATQQPFERLMHEELLEPLGMTSTGFEPSLVSVTGYNRDGRTPIPYWHIVYRPAGGLNASLQDMDRYLRWHLNRGELDGVSVLSPESMQRIETPHTTRAARAGLGFGYGLGNYPWLRSGVLFHGHGGDADGYLSRFGYSHELGRGYFLVINAFQGRVLQRMRATVEAFLIGKTQNLPVPPALSLDPDTYAWVSGSYDAQTRRFGPLNPESRRIQLVLEAHALIQQRESRRQSWLVTQAFPDRIFLRGPDENRATGVVIRSPDGTVLLVSDDGNYLKH